MRKKRWYYLSAVLIMIALLYFSWVSWHFYIAREAIRYQTIVSTILGLPKDSFNIQSVKEVRITLKPIVAFEIDVSPLVYEELILRPELKPADSGIQSAMIYLPHDLVDNFDAFYIVKMHIFASGKIVESDAYLAVKTLASGKKRLFLTSYPNVR